MMAAFVGWPSQAAFGHDSGLHDYCWDQTLQAFDFLVDLVPAFFFFLKILALIVALALGLALLVLSAEALVAAATSIAESLGVSTAIIGLTIVALGTSLPELAASVTCVLKGHHDLAIGNIVGSNILNLLAVLPFPGLFSPGLFDSQLLFRDYVTVLFLTFLLAYFCYIGIKKDRMIGRMNGIVFLLIYAGWFTVMLVQAQS